MWGMGVLRDKVQDGGPRGEGGGWWFSGGRWGQGFSGGRWGAGVLRGEVGNGGPQGEGGGGVPRTEEASLTWAGGSGVTRWRPLGAPSSGTLAGAAAHPLAAQGVGWKHPPGLAGSC